MRVSLGQGVAQVALQADVRQPARLSAQERAQIYQRVLGVPGGSGGQLKPNREFQDLWLRFVSGVAQLGRQASSDDRVRAAARDLALEVGPLVDSASAAQDMWQVVDQVSGLELGGAVNGARYRTLAESGGAILEWLAVPGRGADSAAGIDDRLLQAAQQWLAAAGARDGDLQALSQPEAARRVAAWSQALCRAVGLDDVAPDRLGKRAPQTAALFSGPSGSGKTLAAHWLANSLGREVHRIDLSQIVSKYIGDTEKNIDAVFRHADQVGAVLLFDEAEALFGNRTEVHDAHDRYANQEVSTLLQRIERYEGLAILTSNSTADIDPDVLKRLRAVAFPIAPGADPERRPLTGDRAQADPIRGALCAVAQSPTEWANRLVHQALHPGLLNAASPGHSAARGDAANKEQVKSAFKAEFSAKAADKEGFHACMRQVFGERYDKNLAEQLRQRALAGDFSWLPDVKFVDASTLGGANGAYNAQEGVVYINRDLAAADPGKAAQTFVEEAGHHLDAKLNQADTQGDEGEMFRRVLSGEQLTGQQIAEIRNQNDKGTITVDGKKVEVEFWFGEDIADAVGDVASSAVDKTREVVSDAADYVGNAARDAAYSVGDAVKEAGMGVIDGVGMFMQGFAVDFFGGTFINLFQGRFADAWDSMTRGIDKMVFQAPRRILNGALEGAGHWLKTATYILPEKVGGQFMRDVIDRGVDSVRTVANAAVDVVRNTVRLPFEIVGGFEHDIGEALKHWARGDIGGGFEHFGMAFVHPFESAGGVIVDDAMIVGQAAGNVIGNALGFHEPSRGLNKEERAFLKQTYGDSINVEDIRIHKGNLTHELGMAPHTVGNDIYLPDDCFNADGSLNEKGRMTLVHEAFHVYQAQKGGNDYIHGALEAQVEGIVGSGNRNAAYNWLPAFREGKPFNEWNDEQQAKLIETIARAKYQRLDTDGNGTLDGDYDVNNDGQLDRTELEMAIGDTNRNGRIDGTETAVTLTDDEFRRLMAIADAIKTDRPDRTVV